MAVCGICRFGYKLLFPIKPHTKNAWAIKDEDCLTLSRYWSPALIDIYMRVKIGSRFPSEMFIFPVMEQSVFLKTALEFYEHTTRGGDTTRGGATLPPKRLIVPISRTDSYVLMIYSFIADSNGSYISEARAAVASDGANDTVGHKSGSYVAQQWQFGNVKSIIEKVAALYTLDSSVAQQAIASEVLISSEVPASQPSMSDGIEDIQQRASHGALVIQHNCELRDDIPVIAVKYMQSLIAENVNDRDTVEDIRRDFAVELKALMRSWRKAIKQEERCNPKGSLNFVYGGRSTTVPLSTVVTKEDLFALMREEFRKEGEAQGVHERLITALTTQSLIAECPFPCRSTSSSAAYTGPFNRLVG